MLILSDGTELNLGNAVGKNGANGKDATNGKDGINGRYGEDGKDGSNGTDGVSISGTSVNADGELVITFSDNKTVNVGKIVGVTGLKGEKGDTGRGIAKTEIIDGYLWVTYTDDLENPINVGKVSENNNNECLKFTRISKSTLSVSIKEEYKTFVKKVVIPSEYYGFKVTSIGKSGFSGCEMLEKAILPDTISSIGDEAFYGCISLENIKLSVGTIVIGKNAFRGCSKLQEIVIPANVYLIEPGAFYNTNLTTAVFENPKNWQSYFLFNL